MILDDDHCLFVVGYVISPQQSGRMSQSHLPVSKVALLVHPLNAFVCVCHCICLGLCIFVREGMQYLSVLEMCFLENKSRFRGNH